MFDDIKNKFDSFKPDYVLVEGGFNDRYYKNELDAKLQGESGYVAYLAKESNIAVGTMEPPTEEQIKKLLITYDEDDILVMYLLRQIYQIQRESQNVDINFFDYITSFTKRYISKGFSYSYEDVDNDFITKLLEPYINIKIDNDNWKQIDVHRVVYMNNGIINSIYTDVLNYRDEYAVYIISEKLKSYNRIFYIMGTDHMKAQQGELRKIFDDME